MFHFRFDLSQDGVDDSTCAQDVLESNENAALYQQQVGEPFSEIDLDSLFRSLPTKISYSFFPIPLYDGRGADLKLARRDLFDARFQLISEGTMTEVPDSAGNATGSNPSVSSALEFIDNPSDLIPLVYEGGLKTWECSVDLASCFKREGHAVDARGRRVLELGCGTAVPTLCVLQEIFSSSPAGDAETHIHLQDYNVSVLQLVTMPNVLLAWYTSPAANAYRNLDADVPETDVELELHITPALLDAFQTSLHDHQVYLRFFSGAWDTFDPQRTGGPYHLVLTSETIYHTASLPSLVRVLRDSCSGGHAYHCLVAGKTIYFGVGGGIPEFVRCVETMVDDRGHGGQVKTIWEKATGVSRKVMCVRWP